MHFFMEAIPDWRLFRSFLGVADRGSLSAAAVSLGLSQPTLGRHVADLEARLGLALFRRVKRGLVLTEAGTALVPHARAMHEAAARLALAAAGQSGAMAGAVRVTASRVVAASLLPPLIAGLRIEEPGIEIDLVASDQSDNLLFGEADIALRMYRPTQLDIVTRHLCDLPMGMYAAPDYLDRKGRPRTLDALRTHDLLGLDRSDLAQRLLDRLGIPMTREDFPVRCDDQVVLIELARAGCGIGVLLRRIGDPDARLERLPDILPLPALPVWLAAPQALRQTPRLRRVFDFLAEGVKSATLA
jgi:DNA-binding transcriptional LysR family regulator